MIYHMTTSFSGKTVLVAGGTGGLGRAVTLAFLKAGANVAVTYRKREEFDALGPSSQLEGYATDVTDEAAVKVMVDQIIARHGALNVLVNTVGGYAGGVKFWDAEAVVFDQMIALNLKAGYVLCRAVVPTMLARKQGVIINIAAKSGIDHPAGAASYSASKAAAIAMIDSLAADLKGSGVRANSILPSIIDTDANRKAMPNADYTRWPKPEEIADVILYLGSEDGRIIHGASIPVYGNS